LSKQTNTRALFESLASLSVPLERVFHIAIKEIKNDKEITQKYKKELLASVKALLSNSLELHDYVSKKKPNLNFMELGRVEYNKISSEYSDTFKSEYDEELNLHEQIENLSS
jgi:hypothetical protein